MDDTEHGSWYPIKVLLVDTNEERVCQTIDDVPNNTTFKVIETNVSENIK